MSRRKQAKPRALKHEGDEEVAGEGMASTILQNNGTVKSVVGDMKSDSMLEDITDDDDDGDEQDLEESSDDEPELEVQQNDTNEGSTRCKDMESGMCDLAVSPCEGMSAADVPVTFTTEVTVDELNAKSNHIVKHFPTAVKNVDEQKAVASDQDKPTFDNTSVQSGDSVERPLEMDGLEDKNDDDNEEINDEADDNDDDEDDDDDEIDDELLEDDDDEEGDHVRLDGDGQDVDDDFTSDSFCSELYSSHTSSSFSPSISDGMTTPNSITNDTNDGSMLALGSTDEKPFRQGSNHPAHHIHPRHHHHAHHRRTGTTAGGHSSSAKEGGKASLKHHHQLNNNNSSSHNHNNNNINNHGSNSKGLNSTYHCQFCEKTFPRLGYLKKHEQSHTEHMPFKCEYCARLFKHKRSRDRHTKLHTGDRRYRCLHCEAAFSRSDHLKIHMKTHDNQKPFQCTICNRGYNTAAALTSHMQNHKKQLALTGSPNLTYSPRSTTSSLSSGGGGSGGGKRGAKFSPYASDPLLLMGRGSSKLSSTLAKASGGNNPSNRTPTPGSTSGAPGSGSAQADLLSCPYCTRTDFGTLEQLGLHVQSMHGHGALGLLGADTSLPYFPQGGRRAVTPDGSSLTLGGLPSPYPPIACEFCTMKFPTVPLMFAHLKTSHLDRLAGAGLQRNSPNGTAAGSPLGGSRPPSGFHPLEQLHFNKNLLGNAFPAFYGGMGAGSSANSMSGMSGGSIKMEHRPAAASSNGRDENGNEQSERTGRKRKRKGHDADKESSRKKDKQQADTGANDDGDENEGDEEHVEENDSNVNRSSPVELKESVNSHETEAANIKQESKDETDPTIPETATGSNSTRSSPCDSLGSAVHPDSHPPSGRNSPAEQLTPTDLSQPRMKRLKLESLLEDDDVPEPDRKPMVASGRSHTREHPKQRGAGTNRRDGEPKEPHLSAPHQHHSVAQLHSSGGAGSNVQPAKPLNAAGGTASHHVHHHHQLPGAYLCNQCNAALPDFESFRTHLKAHLEQSAANAAAAMRLTGEHSTAPGAGAGSGNSATSGASSGSLSLATFLCQQCGATLSCQAEYEQHTIGHFLVMAVEYRCQAAGGAPPTGSSCTGKTSFGKVEDLHKHLYDGHMQLLYKCTVCGETFESKVQVQVHFAVSHSVEVKLYRCSACAEVFRTEREFRQHIRNRHLTAGAVQCMFCRMVCSSELEMHFHLASHARKFKCPACPESFHVEFLLDRHIQTQHSQKEAGSPNRREPSASHTLSTAPSTVPCATSNPSLTASTATGTSVSTTATSAVAGLDYLHLHGQMAAMAAAAAWPSLYQTANKFYSNPLQVDTLNQLKHPQHLLHGFYDTMLGKAHQQQHRASFLPDAPTGSGTGIGSKKNPFAGHSPNTGATSALLGLGYGTTSSASSAAASQPQRTAGSHTLNGASTGLYSPEEGTNAATNVPAGSSKLYSPIAMIQRYGDNGGLHSTGATSSSTSRPGAESPTAQLLLASHSTLGLPEVHHHSDQTGRKPNQPSSAKPSSSALAAPGTVTPQITASSSATSCYSCGICERSDFSTESEVQTHRKIVHNLKTGVSLRCAYCNGDFRSRNELENHMKVAHNTGGGKHKCLICDEIFPSPAVLAEHKLSHCKVGASGRCSHCSLPLPDAHTFKQHLPAHQQSMGAPATGAAATNSTTGGGGVGVQSTGSSSSSGQTVGSSSSSTGGNTNAPGSSSTAEQDRFPQQCICCRQTLNSEFEISLHAKFHTKSPDTNERTCALCLEPLPSQPESSTKICDPCLKRHNFPSKLLSMNFLKPSAATSLGQGSTIAGPAHSGIVPTEGRTPASSGIQQDQQPTPARGDNSTSSTLLYQCNLCKKPLPTSQKLQEHLIDHTFAGCEERGYVCYLCSAVFTSSAGLQAHLPVAHTNAAAKPYDCERCGVAYFFRAELEHHLIDHELGRTIIRSVTTTTTSSTVRAGDDEWRSAQNSPVSEDDGLREPQNDHIKQELETEQDGSSPYRHKDDDSDEGDEEPAGHEEDGGDEMVANEERQTEEEEEEEDEEEEEGNDGGERLKQNASEDIYHDKNDDFDDVVGTEESNDATADGDLSEERDQPQQRQQEQEDDEEYIEVDEHTVTMDDGGGKATHNERLRRTSNMLLNGGKDCSTLSAATAPTLPVVTAAE